MFLVIPLVEFLHVLGVDINVHHENPATFLCHMSVSSVKRSRHRFASSRWHPVLSPEPRRDTRHQLGSHLSTRRHTKHHGEEMPMAFSPAPPTVRLPRRGLRYLGRFIAERDPLPRVGLRVRIRLPPPASQLRTGMIPKATF